MNQRGIIYEYFLVKITSAKWTMKTQMQGLQYAQSQQ